MLASSTPATAAIWPERLAGFHRISTKAISPSDPDIWQEYGLKTAEEARYSFGNKEFTATAWRLDDATGAMAVYQWQRPADARPSNLADMAVRTPGGLLLAHLNYVLDFQGFTPNDKQLNDLYAALPGLAGGALPSLPSFLPQQDLIPASQRYVVGPASLDKFDPGIPASVAAFQFSTEAQIGEFHTAAGDVKLGIFNYPTPSIARDCAKSFEALGHGVLVKDSGPLVAVILAPPSGDAAQKILDRVQYQAEVTYTPAVHTDQTLSFVQMILAIFELAGIVLVFCLFSGLAFGGIRVLARRFGYEGAGEHLIVLHLSDK